MARKVGWRIVPLMTAAFFCSYLDRVNIGFAAVTMNKALGMSNSMFGVAAGAFAIGYIICGIPSTLMLHRVGARRWISFIMVAWAMCSAATAFVGNATQLLAMRLLLGAAEAGFIPGIIFYFSFWFTSHYRGRALSAFYSIGPLGLLIGGPLSSAALSLQGRLGLAGWQWLFIVEAVPTLILAVIVFVVMTDRPADATWLSPQDKQVLQQRLNVEHSAAPNARLVTSGESVFRDGRVWRLAFVYLAIGTSGIGAVFFLPLMIRTMGFSPFDTGLMAAIPGIAAGAALPLWGLWTDRSRRREWVVAAAGGAIAAGLLGAALLFPSRWALVPICLAMVGFYGGLAAFWTLPTEFLAAAGAASGIGLINVVGNLGNFTGPALLGAISDRTHSYPMGLNTLAVIATIGAAILIVNTRPHPREVQISASGGDGH
jgi:MFS transporter, ACS family, tartrate transporter